MKCPSNENSFITEVYKFKYHQVLTSCKVTYPAVIGLDQFTDVMMKTSSSYNQLTVYYSKYIKDVFKVHPIAMHLILFTVVSKPG